MGADSAAVKATADLHPLCFEHHAKMQPVRILLKSDIYPAQTIAYACPEPGCPIYYTSPAGYFITSTPWVTCPQHGVPMYLAEIKPEKRSFRLWRCPEDRCKATRTNEEDLLIL